MNYETMYSDGVDQPGLPFCELTFHQSQLSEAFGGGMAGAVLPLIMTPVELIKVQRQILQRQSNNWAVAKDIHGARGIRGLYTGHSLTTTRAILGNTLLFGGTYGLWKKGVVLRLERKVCKVWAPRFLGPWAVLEMLARERALYCSFSSQLLGFIPAHGVYFPLYDVLIQPWGGPS